MLREDDELRVVIVDAEGRDVTADVLGVGPLRIIGDMLRDVIDVAQDDELLRVMISVRDKVADDIGYSTFGEAEVSMFESIPDSVRIRGVLASSDDVRAENDLIDQHRAAVQAVRRSIRYDRLAELSRREGWGISERELDAFGDEFGGFVREMQAVDVLRFAEDNKDIVAALGHDQEDFVGSITPFVALLQVHRGRSAPKREWDQRGSRSAARAFSQRFRGPRSYARQVRLERIVNDFVYNTGVLPVVAAGNFDGNGNAKVVSRSARALNILTVGNYNDITNTIALSSRGQNPTMCSRSIDETEEIRYE